MDKESLLERLDAFFAEGANTDAIGNFLAEEENVMRSLGCSTDTSEALNLYALFKRYVVLVDTLLNAFIAREAQTGSSVRLEQLAAAVMDEWKQEHDYCRYLCTAYIAGALEFDSFKQLVADVNAMTTYPVGDELSDDGSAGDVVTEEDEKEEGEVT